MGFGQSVSDKDFIESLRQLASTIVEKIDGRNEMIARVDITPESDGLPSYRLEMARRIHGTRSRLGRTRESVAEAVKISVRELEQLEAGTYFPKNGSILIRLAEELGVDPFDLDPRFDPGGPLSCEPKR